ncbi:MAG: AAA family ATPase [Acidimicrobiia bacterium]|nr:AAA family ATPase [Acidimicrobiia bacterium]
MVIVERHLRSNLNEALDAFRVAVLHGARQCGKTTLARLVMEERKGSYTTLDDDATREAALNDPITFLAEHPKPLAVDEVQLGGDRLIRAVKQLVDVDPTPGRFLLTGSTNFLTVPTISESLAGRARILRLWPLSQAELAGRPPVANARGFGPPARVGPGGHTGGPEYMDRVFAVGYKNIGAQETEQ